jgi:hypothetical protein
MTRDLLRSMAENFLPRSQRPELIEPLVELLVAAQASARRAALEMAADAIEARDEQWRTQLEGNQWSWAHAAFTCAEDDVRSLAEKESHALENR